MCRKSSTTGSRTEPQKSAHVPPFPRSFAPPSRRSTRNRQHPRGICRGAFFMPGVFCRESVFYASAAPVAVFCVRVFSCGDFLRRRACCGGYSFVFYDMLWAEKNGPFDREKNTFFPGRPGKIAARSITENGRMFRPEENGKHPIVSENGKTPLPTTKKHHIKPVSEICRKGRTEGKTTEEKREKQGTIGRPATFRFTEKCIFLLKTMHIYIFDRRAGRGGKPLSSGISGFALCFPVLQGAEEKLSKCRESTENTGRSSTGAPQAGEKQCLAAFPADRRGVGRLRVFCT